MSHNELIRNAIFVQDADEAYSTTLSRLLGQGIRLEGGHGPSVGAGRSTLELLNFSVVVRNPRERILRNPGRSINLPAAVARFVWMMAGSDRLADIAFYEPKVKFFSDDNVSVPGSNYGQRILQPRPGLNQLMAAIARLKEDPASRRAAISIYHPEDAVRVSRDIPCAFGLFYHVRQGALYSTTVMRSNNAFVLLPYNLFEFSLLAELVAVELQVELGPLTHMAASMHVFEDNIDDCRSVISGAENINRTETPFPPVPTHDSPVMEVIKLVRLEAALRHGSAALSEANIDDWIARGESELNNYWRQLYYLLVIHVARQNHSAGALNRVRTVLERPWIDYLPKGTFDQTASRPDESHELASIELLSDFDLPPARVVPLHDTQVHKSLRTHASAWEREKATSIDWRTFVRLEEYFGNRLAARGEDGGVSREDFDSALNDMTVSRLDVDTPGTLNV